MLLFLSLIRSFASALCVQAPSAPELPLAREIKFYAYIKKRHSFSTSCLNLQVFRQEKFS